MPLTWPNLQDGTCKNSIQIEFQVGPECGKNNEQGDAAWDISPDSNFFLQLHLLLYSKQLFQSFGFNASVGLKNIPP